LYSNWHSRNSPRVMKFSVKDSKPLLSSRLIEYCFHLTGHAPGFNEMFTTSASQEHPGNPEAHTRGVTAFNTCSGIVSGSGVFCTFSCNINTCASRTFSSGICTYIFPFSKTICVFRLLSKSLPDKGIEQSGTQRNLREKLAFQFHIELVERKV